MSALDQAARWRAAAPRLSVIPQLEVGAALICLLLYSQALLGKLFADPTQPDSGEALRLIWPPVYLLTLVLIAFRPIPVLRLAQKSWPILALAGFAMASTAWSIDPDVTLRRSLAIVMNAIFALWLAARFSWPDLVRLIAACFGVLAVGSALAALGSPGFGVMQATHPGAWSGLWGEKNALGGMMATGALSAIAASLFSRGREAWVWRGVAVFCALLVIMSTSRTAMMATLVGMGGPAMIALARQGFGLAAFALAGGAMIVGALAAILITGPAAFLVAIGRDPTLTGRTDIWGPLLDVIAQRPWTGYGYGAFWDVDNGPVFWVRAATAWDVPTAHNAWIETALAIGWLGAGLAFFLYVKGYATAASRLLASRATYWTLPFLTVWGIVSFSESNLLGQNAISWVLLCMTLMKLSERAQP
ncbi:MAG: O-antigen ligase family protein [Pseudomonadota bacterium]